MERARTAGLWGVVVILLAARCCLAVPAQDVPQGFVYFPPEVRSVETGLHPVWDLPATEWPDEETLANRKAVPGPGVDAALADCEFWVRALLVPEMTPDGLKGRLVPLRAVAAQGNDGVRCQFVVGGYAVHIAQGSNGGVLVARKVDAPRVEGREAVVSFVADTASALFREGADIAAGITEANRITQVPWLKDVPYGICGEPFPYPGIPYTLVRDPNKRRWHIKCGDALKNMPIEEQTVWWRRSARFWSDGQAVVFGFVKLWWGRPWLPSAVSDWFDKARLAPPPPETPDKSVQQSWAERCPYSDIPPYWGWVGGEE